MNLLKPNSLTKGDTIAIVATSGQIDDKNSVVRAKNFLESKGFKVVLGENIFDCEKYLAGNDYKKISELHKFFLDSEVKAIMCARGGYGSIRLIKNLDYELIKQNPKIFCGYSDICALSLMMLKKSNLMTYHAPMAVSDFACDEVNEFTWKNFINTVNNKDFCYESKFILNDGVANGILWGGNLSTVVSLCGLDFLPDEDFIFFVEDINEPVYKIDRMMFQLMNINKFSSKIKGIVLGEFMGIDNEIWLKDLFEDIGKRLNIPVYCGFDITHGSKKITLPYGVNSRLEQGNFKFSI